jgi:hypothetical protein
MSKTNKIWIPALIPVMLWISCGKQKEPTAAQAAKIAETGRKICEKLYECVDEQFKDLPPEMREKYQSILLTKESCYKDYGVYDAEDAAQSEKVEYTKEEVDLAIQCLEDITKSSCEQLQSDAGQPDSCKKLASVVEKREKK